MTAVQAVEIAFAAGAVVYAIILYRQGKEQSTVLLLILAALLAIHGFGLLEYRPSAAELGR
jgi:hypothetical protein